MFASLRSRLIAVAALVALVAVLATAYISQLIASDDLRDALDRDLEAQAVIVDSIDEYVLVHRTWEGIDELVDFLADEADTRVAIRDELGRAIADSNPEAELPDQPVGVVDARSSAAEDALFEVGDKVFFECQLKSDDIDDLFECLDSQIDLSDLPAVGLVYVGEGDITAASILGDDGPDVRVVAVAVLAVIGAIGTMVLAVRPVLAPIEALRAGARRLGHGDLSARVPTTGSTELAELGATFNSMAESLQEDQERRQQWTSDVAHELRNPVQNLRGQLEAAQDGLMTPDDEWFDSLIDEVDQLGHLVNDLQVLTLADSGRIDLNRSQVDLAHLADEVVTSHRPRAEQARVELAVTGSAHANADPRRIRQVLGNLLDNAIRHTPAGGSVTISLSESSDGRPEIEVADTGEGIIPEAQEHIFDRFTRADAHRGRQAGGSGLGLSIVAALVDAHGGTVSVESEVGQGATFRVVL